MRLPVKHNALQFSSSRPVQAFLFLFALLLGGQLLQAQTTWDGSDSNDWFNAANWSAGVPDAADDVTIPGSMPNNPNIGAAGALAKSVQVQASATLTIAAMGSLAINGFIPYPGVPSITTALFNAGTVTNNGILSVGSTSSAGTVGISNTNIINNNAGGQLFINRTTGNGFWNAVNAATMTNAGNIAIGGIASVETGINNQGSFTNTLSGGISIDNATSRGISNFVAITFLNYGTITIGASGNLGAEAIRNTATPFDNNGCTALIKILSNSIIVNTGIPTLNFNNSGLIIENATGNSNITTNTGIVQDLNGGMFSIGTNTGLLTTSAGPMNACCFISGPTSVCANAQITLSGNCGTGGTWSSNNTAVAMVNSANGLVTGMSAGTATISYTQGSNTATTVVTVNAAPNAAIAITENNVFFNPFTNLAYNNVSYTDGLLCTSPSFPNPTTSATLTASGGGTYLWSNSSTNNSITVSTAGTYTVVVTNAGCQSTVTKTIAVNPAPNAGTITATPNLPSINGGKGVCFGSTITLSSTVPGGEWSMFTGFQVVSVNSVTGLVTPIVNTNNTDTSSVRYQVSALGCVSGVLTQVEVLNSPSAGTISGNPNICGFLGNTTQLTINNGASGGTWASSNTNVATVNASGFVQAAPTTTNTGTSIISYTVTNGTCTNTATILITVNANPSALVTSTPYNACINTDVTISVPDAGTGATYAWSGNVATTSGNPIVSNSSTPGFKVYQVTVTAANGCSNTGFGSHIVNQPISTTITATPNPVCLGLTLDLSVPSAASTTYAWTGPGLNSTTGNSVTATPTTTGMQTYMVTATTNAFLGNCVATGNVNVMVETTQPSCIITGSTSVCSNAQTTFNAPAGLSGYSWGVTGDATISGATNGASLSVIAGTSGSYTVSVTVTSASGCTNTCNQTVTINTIPSCPSTYIPSNGQNAVGLNIGTLDWNDVLGATTYLVSFGTNAPDYNNILNNVSVTMSNTSIGALSSSQTYGYSVVPVNVCGQAVGCSTITFSTCVPSFTCPANRNVNLNANCAMVVPDLVTGLAANPGCGSLTFTQNPTAGTVVPSAHNATVSVTIMPSNPATSTCAVILTGKDVTPPTVACKSFTANLLSAGTASITTSNVFQSGSDNCGTVNQVSVTPNAFTCANLGVNTVVLTVNDGNSNTATCSATVTIVDATAPTVICKNFTINLNAAGAASITTANVFQSGSDNCGTVNQVSVLPNAFTCANTGTNTVVLTVSDGGSNTATCSAIVTVADAAAPTIICPINIIRTNDLNQCNASVAYATPIASDNCGGAVASHFSGGVSGAVFQKGTTTVIWRATDGGGLTSSCSFSITVNDTQKPNITCPVNQTRSTDLGQCSAVVTYPTPTGTDNCGLPTGQPVWIGGGINAAGSTATFQKGATVVIWKATDAASNAQTCSFRVTVNDTEAPTLTCPAAISINTTPNLCSAVATYTNPPFTDNCAPTTGTAVRISGLVSGSTFPVGNSNVVFQATDAAGNTRRCTMVVTVTDNQPPVVICPPSIIVTGSGTPCMSTVFFANATASDNCAGTLTPFLFSGLASGSAFPAGVTTNTFRAVAPNGQSAACSFTVTVNCGSGMGNEGLEDRNKDLEAQIILTQKTKLGLTIAPNPATSFVTMGIEGVDANGGTLLVFDQIGRLVQQQVIASDQRTTTLQVGEFAPGLYRIMLKTDDGMVTKTLVVVKE